MERAAILMAYIILPINAQAVPADHKIIMDLDRIQDAVPAAAVIYLQNELSLASASSLSTADLVSRFLAPLGSSARIHFVDGVCGSDSWTGARRACAAPNGPKRTIQAAIHAAAGGDVIVVLPATYFENLTIQDKDLLIAGFPEQTIIDAAGAGRAVHISNSTTSLFGITVQNGSAETMPIGGGFLCENSSVVIVTSVIMNNFASDSGGGIFNLNSEITMKSCQIRGNSTSAGVGAGGAGLYGGLSGSYLLNCIVENNTILFIGDGAGIRAFDGVIEGCVITDNHIAFEAHLDGGGGLSRCTGPVIGCTISNNSVEFGDGGGASECSGPFINCIITGNIAYSGIGDVVPVSGGGLARCSGPITNCLIADNVAQNTDHVLPAIESRGGGLADCTGPITNCTIANNRAVDNIFGSCGGGLWNCTGSINNCIVWQNGAIDDPQVNASSAVNYSCIQDWPGGGLGNIPDDPLFVDMTDYRTRPGSPAIDAGDNDAVPSAITTDLAGNSRFFDDPATIDTGNGAPPVVDMGAYEFSIVCGDSAHPYPPMDFNHDCIVDFLDLALFCEHWLECTKPECRM